MGIVAEEMTLSKGTRSLSFVVAYFELITGTKGTTVPEVEQRDIAESKDSTALLAPKLLDVPCVVYLYRFANLTGVDS